MPSASGSWPPREWRFSLPGQFHPGSPQVLGQGSGFGFATAQSHPKLNHVGQGFRLGLGVGGFDLILIAICASH